jgi:hypothetical protein
MVVFVNVLNLCCDCYSISSQLVFCGFIVDIAVNALSDQGDKKKHDLNALYREKTVGICSAFKNSHSFI